jgi:hypothetical protein
MKQSTTTGRIGEYPNLCYVVLEIDDGPVGTGGTGIGNDRTGELR